MAIELSIEDYAKIGKVATHCDNDKLEIAEQEAIEFDLMPILCNLFAAVDTNWGQESGVYADLINPTTYENCAGFETKHTGLKNVLAYYSYGRYQMLNGFDDTANGAVTKTNNFSIPKPLAEVKQFSSKYRQMAKASFIKVEAFILQNIDDYAGYDCSNLKGCGCNGSCGKTANVKGYGLKSKNIRK